MTRLNWSDAPKEYSSGVSRGVYYDKYNQGYAWVGLTGVQETSEDDQFKAIYQNGVRFRNRLRPSNFAGSITSFSHPKNFFDDPLTNQKFREFSFSYTTNRASGKEIHLVYNAMIQPSKKDYSYKNVSEFSWDFTTRPIFVPGAKPSAHLIIKTSKISETFLSDIEDVLYGSFSTEPRIPLPFELKSMFSEI